MRPARRAQLALALEVAATPTPGAVDRRHDHADLRFDHLLAGAVGAADGLDAAADGEAVGPAFERAVAGMAAAQSAGNTQFGALLLLVPLVRAAGDGDLTPRTAGAVVEATTVADAVAFARAFDHVDVALGEPPPDLADLDMRAPTDAIAAIEARGIALADLMERWAAVDGIAREWASRFERTFAAADRLLERSGPLPDRAASTFLELLAEAPDPHIARRHGSEAARHATDRARAVLDGDADVGELSAAFAADGINPGTTADLLGGGLFVALERGVRV